MKKKGLILNKEYRSKVIIKQICLCLNLEGSEIIFIKRGNFSCIHLLAKLTVEIYTQLQSYHQIMKGVWIKTRNDEKLENLLRKSLKDNK